MKKYAAAAAIVVALGIGGCAIPAGQEASSHDTATRICESLENGATFDELILEHGEATVDHAALEVCSFS